MCQIKCIVLYYSNYLDLQNIPQNLPPRNIYDPNTIRNNNPSRMPIDQSNYVYRQPRPINPTLISRGQPNIPIIRQRPIPPLGSQRPEYQGNMYDNYQGFVQPNGIPSPPLDYGINNDEYGLSNRQPRLSPPITQPSLIRQRSSPSLPQNIPPINQEPLTVDQQYGIEGLNRVMKMDTPSDPEILALGLDLMTLGLLLSSNENMYIIIYLLDLLHLYHHL